MWKNTTTISKQDFYFLNKKSIKYIVMLACIGIVALICSISLVILKSKFWPLIVGSMALLLGEGYALIVIMRLKKKIVGKTLDYTFDEDSFTISTNSGSSNLSYSTITNYLENESTLLLYISPTQAYVVNKSTLEQECLTFIKQKIKPQVKQSETNTNN